MLLKIFHVSKKYILVLPNYMQSNFKYKIKNCNIYNVSNNWDLVNVENICRSLKPI